MAPSPPSPPTHPARCLRSSKLILPFFPKSSSPALPQVLTPTPASGPDERRAHCCGSTHRSPHRMQLSSSHWVIPGWTMQKPWKQLNHSYKDPVSRLCFSDLARFFLEFSDFFNGVSRAGLPELFRFSAEFSQSFSRVSQGFPGCFQSFPGFSQFPKVFQSFSRVVQASPTFPCRLFPFLTLCSLLCLPLIPVPASGAGRPHSFHGNSSPPAAVEAFSPFAPLSSSSCDPDFQPLTSCQAAGRAAEQPGV